MPPRSPHLRLVGHGALFAAVSWALSLPYDLSPRVRAAALLVSAAVGLTQGLFESLSADVGARLDRGEG